MWLLSMQAVMRLFRMIEDTTSASFDVDDRQWRSSAIDIFRFFFSALWEDDHVRISFSSPALTHSLE